MYNASPITAQRLCNSIGRVKVKVRVRVRARVTVRFRIRFRVRVNPNQAQQCNQRFLGKTH